MNAAVALLCVAAAFACALADSALLRASIDAGEALPPPEHEARHRALLFGRLLALVGAGAAAARAAAGAPSWAWWVVVLAAGIATVAVAEAAAREFGDALGSLGTAAAEWAAGVGRAAAAALAPALWLATAFDGALRRVLPPLAPTEATREEATEQFREIVAAEAEGGAGEGALVAGVFTLGDLQVSDVMVPRVDVVGVEQQTPWAEVVARVRSAEHSRVPVYDETIDDVTGVLYAKDVLAAVVADDAMNDGWRHLVRPAQFIPATKHIDAQLRDFRASGNHLAVVADEYGGTAGIVTIEDVLEEIVGEIRDERDQEEPPVESEGGRRYWVSARLTLEELSAALKHEFVHDEVATTGGLVYEVLGRVPRNGERLTIGPFRVIVERVVRRKIQRLYFERVEPEAPSPAGDGGQP